MLARSALDWSQSNNISSIIDDSVQFNKLMSVRSV